MTLITQEGDKPIEDNSTKTRPGFQIAKESIVTLTILELWLNLMPVISFLLKVKQFKSNDLVC